MPLTFDPPFLRLCSIRELTRIDMYRRGDLTVDTNMNELEHWEEPQVSNGSSLLRSSRILNDEIRAHSRYIAPKAGCSTISETSFSPKSFVLDHHQIYCKSPLGRQKPSPRIWDVNEEFVSSPFSDEDRRSSWFYMTEYKDAYRWPKIR